MGYAREHYPGSHRPTVDDPLIGLLVWPFRQRFNIQTTPWWYVFPHRDEVTMQTIDQRQAGLDVNGPMTVEGGTATFEQMRAGVEEGNTRPILIGNRCIGTIQIQKKQWTNTANLSLDNYRQVPEQKDVVIKNADGTLETVRSDDFLSAMLNSLTVSIPATVIPILIAAFAAYGFAWINFRGKQLLFTLVVALLVVPLQIALVPVLRDFAGLHINGIFLGIWLVHTGFGLSLATYLLYNYIFYLPRETLESASIDGASHFNVFRQLVLPLSVPALASFAIFQFLSV